MPTFCPRNDQDPDSVRPARSIIDSPEVALGMIIESTHHPARAEVIALILSPDFTDPRLTIVDGTVSPDAVIEVMELLAEASAEFGYQSNVVLASVRPGDGPLPGDVDRWIELSDLAESHGCELVEWFVISDGIAWCPRDFLVEPPRWPGDARAAWDRPW